jgi:hypothetical protein
MQMAPMRDGLKRRPSDDPGGMRCRRRQDEWTKVTSVEMNGKVE